MLQNLTKVYDDRSVVKDFTLSVSDGEFVALLGPSGCGKSTILAMIAGFEQPDAGSVSIDGRCVDTLPPQRRKVGLVMQDYAIFSRMTVQQNLEFGLKMQSLRSSERRARVSELVERLSLGDLLKRKGDALNLSEMQQVDSPERLHDMPANRFVAEFIGSPPMNLIPARLHAEGDSFRLVGSGFAGRCAARHCSKNSR
jgi:ABC-type sugar transport system ATPase subunit